MKITIFTTRTCPYCQMLKQYLKEKNVLFSEKLVDENEQAREEMASLSGGFLGVPFVLIVKDSQTSQTVVGFNKIELDKIFY